MLQFNLPTPLQQCRLRGFSFLLKRDDLISKEFSGNKARKIAYYLNNLPANITTIVSYGSIQSNAMYSLSVFAKLYNLNFRYYANHIPTYLKEKPQGNLYNALKNGMQLAVGYENIEVEANELFINEGIATKKAYFGIEKLAKELLQTLGDTKHQIFLPSGTGTTALFLSKAFKKLGVSNLEVYTTPCIGSCEYLLKQFKELEPHTHYYPRVVDTKKRYHFGKLYREFYQIWLELQNDTAIEFDMLYDPKGWLTIFENIELFDNLVYIHQGGTLGNQSMLPRYKRKYGVLNEDSENKQ